MFFVEHKLFLFSLVSIAILVLFHLIKRKNIKEVYFPSLIFIMKSHKKVSKKLKLREIILFLLRLIALMSIIFLISNISLKEDNGINTIKTENTIIIIDNNYQMLLKEKNKTDFELAKERVTAFFNNNKGKLSIYHNGKSHLISSSFQLSSILKKIKIVYDDNYSDIKSFLKEKEKYKDKKVVFITNTIKNNINSKIKYSLIHHKKIDNFYIKNIKVKRYDYLHYSLTLTVKSSSSFKSTKKLTLYNGQKAVNNLLVTLMPGESKKLKINFTVSDKEKASSEFTLKLENDYLNYDNYRVFVINKVIPKEILIINGEPSSISYQDEAFYYKNALLSSENSYKFNLTQKNFITSRMIKKYDLLVFLNNTFDDYENKDAVAQFLNSGKSVFITLGSNTNINNFNYFWENTIILRNLKDLRKNKKYKYIDYFNKDYDFLKNIQFVKEQLSAFPVFKYYNLETRQNLNTIASLNDGTPFIVEKKLKKGKLILYVSTIDRDWNDFPLSTNFPPLIISLTNYLLNDKNKENYYYIQDLTSVNNLKKKIKFIKTGFYKDKKTFAYNSKLNYSDIEIDKIGNDQELTLNNNLLIPLKNWFIIIFGFMILLETLFFLRKFLRGKNEQ